MLNHPKRILMDNYHLCNQFSSVLMVIFSGINNKTAIICYIIESTLSKLSFSLSKLVLKLCALSQVTVQL